jgi:hypothetical protein
MTIIDSQVSRPMDENGLGGEVGRSIRNPISGSLLYEWGDLLFANAVKI